MNKSVCVCYLYAVEGSALLLVQQGVVVGQLDQLVQLFVRIFLLQFLQDTNHLEERAEDTLMINISTQHTLTACTADHINTDCSRARALGTSSPCSRWMIGGVYASVLSPTQISLPL